MAPTDQNNQMFLVNLFRKSTPGYVWHITHRCHKREFLLKFDKDKKRWIHWLFEAKKRFGLSILSFTVTSNHIHLLVYDGKVNIIPKSIQLIAGRTAREYNQRKNRKGAFWEDRYHATAVRQETIWFAAWRILIWICSEPELCNIPVNGCMVDIMRSKIQSSGTRW